MNLLDTNSSTAQKKYLIDKFKQNNLNTAGSKPFKEKKYFSKKVFLYVMFVFLIGCGGLAISTDKFIVNADKISSASGAQTGDSVVFPQTPLTAKVQKSAFSTYTRGDNRIMALKQFLESKKSPASAYADVFVNVADSVGMDYRLVASISGVESGFCRANTIRIDSNQPTYNCWGWGKNGKRFAEFSSYTESITAITKGIAKGYGKNPTPAEMQDAYCTSCRGSNNWQETVVDYMNEISAVEKKTGK